MKCLSACFTAIAPFRVMVFLTIGGLGSAFGILHNATQEQYGAMQEKFISNAAGPMISGSLPGHGRAEFFAGAELVSLHTVSQSRADERFLTLEASGEYSGWVIHPYRSPFDGNQYARDTVNESINDMPVRRVADVSSEKLEMTPAIYQFTLEPRGLEPRGLEPSGLEPRGEILKLHNRESAKRFSF